MSTVQTAGGDALRAHPGRERQLEDLAFKRLRALDVEGSRAAFAEWADVVVASTRTGARPARGAVLMFHVALQEAHRRLERPDPGTGTDARRARYWDFRDRVIARFAVIEGADEARRTFVESLDRLFAPWQGQRKDRHPIVRRARVFIRENYHQRVSLSSVAGQLNVSANYLSRQFRRETGMTLTSYIQRVRLDRARELLADKERTIAEIAYLVGYQNYRDFYRNFVKYENASPSQVQRRLIRSDPRS